MKCDVNGCANEATHELIALTEKKGSGIKRHSRNACPKHRRKYLQGTLEVRGLKNETCRATTELPGILWKPDW